MSYLSPVSARPVIPTQVAQLPAAVTPAAPSVGDVFVGRVASVGPTASAAPDGRAFVQAAVEEIRARVARGEPCRVVFDIDDTLADSRGRTLHILKAYDQARGTSHFADLTLDQVGGDGAITAQNLGLPKDVVKDVRGYWQANFFDSKKNIHDLPMTEIIELAKAASEAGAEVRYLTGRTEDIREDTLAQLKRFGLPDTDDAHLFMKPNLKVKTGDYKAAVFKEWAKDDVFTGFFITESRRDIAFVQGAVSADEVPCVLIDSEKDRHGPAIDPRTPVYPSQTNVAPKLGWLAA